MTLEEAKKEIKELADSKWETFHNEGNLITSGEAMAYEESCHILDEIDAEPVRNPDKMTPAELACEFRKMSDEEKAYFLTILLRGKAFIDGWNYDHGINGARVKGEEVWLLEV